MNIQPAQRVNQIQEYYFSKKLKEVAQLQASGNDIIVQTSSSLPFRPHGERKNYFAFSSYPYLFDEALQAKSPAFTYCEARLLWGYLLN